MSAIVIGVDQMCTPKQITQCIGVSSLPLGLALPVRLGTPTHPAAEGCGHFHAKTAFLLGPILALSHLKLPHAQVTIVGMGQ